MADAPDKVRPALVSKQDTSAALGAAWGRVANQRGRGAFAEQMGIDVKTLARSVGGESVPELHTALNSLLVDPTALDEVFAKYGFELHPMRPLPANDLSIMAGLSHLVGQWAEVMADGVRDHRETCQLADEIRPLRPLLDAVIAEADRIRGAH